MSRTALLEQQCGSESSGSKVRGQNYSIPPIRWIIRTGRGAFVLFATFTAFGVFQRALIPYLDYPFSFWHWSNLSLLGWLFKLGLLTFVGLLLPLRVPLT